MTTPSGIAVTVLVTAYNYGAYLPRALCSALAQRMPKEQYEVVVVDDGSTDDTPVILERFAGRVHAIRQQNAGLPAACNTGIAAANGRYLLRLDADDELHTDTLAKMAAVLDADPTVGLVYCDRLEVEGGQHRVKRVGEGNIYEIIAGSIMFRTEILRQIGGYRPLYWEEHDVMLRYLRRGRPAYLAEPLYIYHVHGDSMTGRADVRREGWRRLIKEWGIDELRRWGRYEELEQTHALLAAGEGEFL